MFTGIKNQLVTVTPQNSTQAGGCNGCSSYTDAKGSIPHRVWQIDLRSCSFRVCDECKKVLMEQLGRKVD